MSHTVSSGLSARTAMALMSQVCDSPQQWIAEDMFAGIAGEKPFEANILEVVLHNISDSLFLEFF
jgi:hypothetical protein